MRKQNYILYIISFLIFFSINSGAQNTKAKTFFKLPRPEKCWVIFHPFKAKRAFDISNEAKHLADSVKNTNLLDGDANGGQVDAFRHSYWMAILVKEIGVNAAEKLGKAHEKGNYICYKKNKFEDGVIPDSVSSVMDLYNNEIGIKIYKNNFNKSNKEIMQVVVTYIKDGKMLVIIKNKKGKFLDCEGNIILQEELIGKWQNNKCLDSSKI